MSNCAHHIQVYKKKRFKKYLILEWIVKKSKLTAQNTNFSWFKRGTAQSDFSKRKVNVNFAGTNLIEKSQKYNSPTYYYIRI